MYIILSFSSPNGRTDIMSILQIRKTEGQASRVTKLLSLQELRDWAAGLSVLKPGQPQANPEGWSPYQDTLPHITQARV